MRLSVNIDHIATLRQARKGTNPDPVAAAVIAELAGASGITVHLRQDRRHIQERDLYMLRETVKGILNVEVALTDDALNVMRAVKPDQVTLVPERPEELTTEGGLDLTRTERETAEHMKLYADEGIAVSLFINPDSRSVKIAQKLRAKIVEFNTAEFGAAKPGEDRNAALSRVAEAVRLAGKTGIEVHAGHDINYLNATELKTIDGIAEASIGHAIVARASLVGLDRAVREMLALIG